jgi:hypothetical protein
MAISVDYQVWTNTGYNWLDKTTPTGAALQINDKLVAWVAAVNANASNATRQVTIKKGPADSTSANFVGWVIECASPNPGGTFYPHLYSNSATAATAGVQETWTFNTANGGYGTPGGSGDGRTNATWNATASVSAEFAVATDSTNGQEFFALGWRHSDATNNGCLCIFKDNNGDWAGAGTLNGTNYGSFYMPVHTTPKRAFGIAVADTTSLTAGSAYRLAIRMNSVTGFLPTAGTEYTSAVSSTNPDALCTNSSTTGFAFGRFATLASGKTAVCLGGCIFVRY